MFLNSEYTDGNAGKAVLEFLDFVKDSKNTDTTLVTTELGRMVRNVVESVRNDEELEERYMTLEMLLMERENKGREEGREEGVIKGVVKTYKKFGRTQEETTHGIMEEFSLPREVAVKQVALYW